MRASVKWSPGVLVCLLALGVAEAHAAPPAKARDELSVIHVLVVADTNANIGASVKIDEDNFSGAISKGVADANRVDLTRLDGDNATPQKIVDYFKNLTVGQNEGVVFFYAGHGATIEKDHTVTLSAGNLKRVDLLNAMQATKAPLIICLTDCCSTQIVGGRVVRHFDAQADNPVVLNLFFQSRGVVDITAATLDSSMGDDTAGGFFTRSLCNCLRDKPENLAATGDNGFVSWNAFFDKIKQATDSVCTDYARKVRDNGGSPAVEHQVPLAWSLGGDARFKPKGWRFGMRVFNNNGDGVRIGEVLDGSPAKNAGFEAGDVLLKINDKTMKSEDDFKSVIDASNGHIKVVFRNVRNKKEATVPDIALEPITK
jgi:membrane-associated protease RseP (regulator of RpoE activity)